MEETAIEKEKRRQRIERRKKRRRRLLIQRGIVLGGLFLLVILLVKCGVDLVKRNAEHESVSVSNNGVGEEDNELEAKVQQAEKAPLGPTVMMTMDTMQEGKLILVNEDYPLRKYDNLKLVNVVEHNERLYRVKSETVKLNEEALVHFNQMIKDFESQYEGHDIGLVSGFRNYDEQERLHYEAVKGQEGADSDLFVARPDRSEHHTGLAIDIGFYYADGTSGEFDGTGDYSWIAEHCSDYGFIIRYEEEKKKITGIGNEPWHLRYVGVPHAQIMKELHLCLEEYIDFIKSYRYYTKPYQSETGVAANYSIYYVPVNGESTEIPIPEKHEYEISGNNKDGFIVTVKIK